VTGIQDDHDPNNVDGPLAWPQVDGLVEDLALRFGTEQIGSGTIVTNLYMGIGQYITDHNLRQGYVITQVARPEFWWVAEEVERSEDALRRFSAEHPNVAINQEQKTMNCS